MLAERLSEYADSLALSQDPNADSVQAVLKKYQADDEFKDLAKVYLSMWKRANS